MSDDLPMGWVETTLSEIGNWGSGGTPKATNHQYYNGSIPWAKIGDLNDGIVVRTEDAITEEGLLNSSAKIVEEGTLLIAMYGSIGKLGIAGTRLATNQAIAFCNIFENLILKKFAFYYLRSRREHLLSMGQGGTQQNISQTILKAYPALFPPLNEQRRIVDKLERIGDRHRTARNELNHIPKLIARYKQAVLAAAFRGDLTADWRKDSEIKTGELWSIPIDWSWKQIKDIAEIASNLVQPSEVLDLPHIAPNHIESGIPRLLPFKTVREDKVISAKHRFFNGQIIYSKIRPYLRKAVIVDFEGVCSADMYPINARCNSKYLLYWLISEDFNNLAVEHQGRTVLPKINQVGLYKLPIPVPSELEQKEIVRRVEKMFEKIDRMEEEYQQAAKLCDRLEQATLAKAFRGELVPQDPDDEPASVLLEQVKREKEKGKIKTKK